MVLLRAPVVRDYEEFPSLAKMGLRRAALSCRSSGNTRVVPTTVMKLVSPFHRGTR
jgi:hypothetical protein